MAPILLCVLVWTAFAWSPTRAHLNETIYAVTVSSRVTGGASETLCAHVLSPPEPLALRVTLEAQSGSTVILEKTVSTDYYGCSTFQVPIVTSSMVATVNVTIQGESAVMSKKTKVLIAPPAFLHLIVTDKPLYKPGQTVQFRIVSMDAGFIPFNELVRDDPNRNRIAQWLDRTAVSGILDLSHPMSPEAAQGPYTITAWTEKGESTSRSFDIKEYGLPPTATNTHTRAHTYTYGKPVLGSIKVVVCRESQGHFSWHYSEKQEDICVTSQLQTDRTGCATHFIRVSEFGPRVKMYRDMFDVTAEMEEYGTGVVIQASGQTPFSVNVRELTFENVADNTAYKPGIPFEGKVMDICHEPSNSIYIYIQYVCTSYNLTLLTQDNGMASFSLDTSLWKNSVVLTASSRPKEEQQSFVHGERLPAYPSAVLTMGPFYSKSKSFVKISANGHKSLCEGESQVGAQYIIQGEELRPGQEELPFYYTVSQRCKHFTQTLQRFALFIKKTCNLEIYPYAQVVVYTLMPSGEVLADNKDFPVDQCFENKVNLEFSADRELPGGEASFRLESQPGSLCSVRAVDQSILLLQPDQELSVFNKLPVQKLSGFSYRVEDREPDRCSQPWEEMEESTAKDDVYSVFKVRYESLFDVVTLSICRDSGSVSVVKTLPDTITSWRAQAFCTSSSLGFGLSRDTALVAFQPFFVSLTLPYSVVRGEVFTLRATVFNYLPSCIMVGLSLSNSSHFSLRECADCQYTMCVCAEESRVFQWEVSPSSLGEVTLEVRAEALHTEQLCGNEVAPPPTVGRVDTVVRKLLVEVRFTLMDAEKNISLLLPDLFVAGSARASFSVLGDLMGRAMKNLDKLLAMPYGCGEQNMILFAPNIYILNYLTSTAQLTHAIKERATRFLESGYQRELTYRHDDGSYSAFGKSDASGNTWLTAFVMKSFGGAKPYIFIDPKLIEDSRTWLLSHRRQDGCITSVGKLFHNGMKGGVSDDVSLTAYITAALLELDAVSADPMVSGCLQCLRVAVAGKLENMYTTALLSYTFTLAGDQQTRAALLTPLTISALLGGTRHWKRTEASETVLDSLEVEMTAYVLLAVLSGPPVPGFDLDYASSITRWLIQQQNPYGGFASTQDTVVALQALARYGAATYSSEGACVVGLSSLGGASWQFTVDQSTRLLYQEQALDRLPGDYRITAQGQGCVQAQVGPPGAGLCTGTGLCPGPGLCFLPVLLRYQGRREETNMVIINLKLLSGYGLQQSTLQEVSLDSSVKRVDFEEGYINIYLDGLKKEVLRSYSVTLEEEEAVRNLRPAVVKVYDYYQTSDEAVADYSSPCAERKYTQFNHAQLKLAKVPA
uniref:Alpha-2-macroglobulin-like protein 1 n=1 Tax=Gadus morhua TaxID=8049 RepID=A0A8C5B239_GADMO